jgi:hypothetical protein
MTESCIVPEWNAPPNVRALVTTRYGGASGGAYAGLNLGDHVGDDPALVAQNRAALRAMLPAEPVWLRQVHGVAVAVADADAVSEPVEADASVARRPGKVCAVLTADCLPLLLCDDAGTVVAAAHAGWRGLAAGVIECTVRSMGVAPASLIAYLGPAIGPAAFEVGDEVRQTFVAADPAAQQAFTRHSALSTQHSPLSTQKWLADIYLLARQRLQSLGVDRIHGGGYCTHNDPQRFYSYRRDGATGRMASLIWLDR